MDYLHLYLFNMMIFFMLNKPQGITGHQGLEAPKHSQVAALGPGRRRKWTWSYLEIPAMGNLGGLAASQVGLAGYMS